MSLKYLVNLDLSKNELQNFAIQKLASAPSNPVLAQMYYSTADNLIYVCTETGDTPVWTPVGSYTFSDGLNNNNRVITVVGGDGIAVDSNGVHVDLASDRGLVVDADSKLNVKIEANKGLTVGADGFATVVNADKAMEVGSSGLGVVANSAKAIEATSSGVGVVANAAKAIEATSSGVGVVVKANSGLKASSDGLEALVDTAAGLAIDSTSGKIKGVVNTAAGLAFNATSGAVEVVLQDNKGVAFDANGKLGTVVNAAKAVEVGADGIGVVVKANSGLKASSDGLEALVDDKEGLAIDSTSGKIKAVVDTASGLAIDSTSGKIKGVIDTASGLAFDGTSGAVKVVVDTTKALKFDDDGKLAINAGNGVEFSGNALQVKKYNGIEVDSNGVAVKAKANSGVSVTSDGVGLALKSNSGLATTADGLEVLLDGDANLSFTAAGKVTLATDSTPTADSTKPLTSGGAYTALSGKVDRLATEHSAAQDTVSVVTYDKQGLVTGGTTVVLGAASVAGGATGIATLGTDGKVPTTQLPSYVDDVIEGYYDSTTGKFYEDQAKTKEITGETGKIYVDLATNKTYRWSGSAFVDISNPIGYADKSEAEAGTENTKVMTALRVRESEDYWGTSVTATLTNKTFDANGTGNSLSNVELADFADGVVQTTVRASGTASDTSVATEAAVRAAIGGVVSAAVHRYVATNEAITPSSGVATWTISGTGLDADVEVQVKEVATGAQVMMEVESVTAGTVTLKFNATEAVAAGTYKAIIMGYNA